MIGPNPWKYMNICRFPCTDSPFASYSCIFVSLNWWRKHIILYCDLVESIELHKNLQIRLHRQQFCVIFLYIFFKLMTNRYSIVMIRPNPWNYFKICRFACTYSHFAACICNTGFLNQCTKQLILYYDWAKSMEIYEYLQTCLHWHSFGFIFLYFSYFKLIYKQIICYSDWAKSMDLHEYLQFCLHRQPFCFIFLYLWLFRIIVENI